MNYLYRFLFNNPIFVRHRYGYIITYGLYYALAVASFYWVLITLLQNEHSTEVMAWQAYFIVLLVPAFLAKLMYTLFHIMRFLKTPIQVLNETGFAFFGGMIGLVCSACLLNQIYTHINLLALTDYLVLSLLPSMIFIRLGCASYGCCYGRPSDNKLSVTFTHPLTKACRNMGTQPLIPTQLFSLIKNIFIFFVIIICYYLIPIEGLTTCLWLALYSILRFFVDFSRDPSNVRTIQFSGWRLTQLFCVLIFSAAMFGLLLLDPKTLHQVRLEDIQLNLKLLDQTLILFLSSMIIYGYHSKDIGHYFRL
jgi:phosphatidylglycerol:prolipoprotein diacylglycerol transferase